MCGGVKCAPYALSAISPRSCCVCRNVRTKRTKRTKSGKRAAKKCEKSDQSAKSPLLTCKRVGLSSITETLLQNLNMRDIALRLESTSAGDKRDVISAYALRISDCPVVTRRVLPLASVGLGFPVVWRFLSCQNCSIKSAH